MLAVVVAAMAAAHSAAKPAVEQTGSCLPAGSKCPPRVIVGALVGQGLRFNNPYRLGRSLGRAGHSVSLTPNHVEVVGRLVWPWQGAREHGLQLGLLYAVNGVSQWLAVPSYRVQWAAAGDFGLAVRGAFPLVLSPDFNVGAEAACALQYALTPAVRLEAELAGSLFVGAAVPERSFSVYPLLSVQAGLTYRFGAVP